VEEQLGCGAEYGGLWRGRTSVAAAGGKEEVRWCVGDRGAWVFRQVPSLAETRVKMVGRGHTFACT
jgi:hypothetical protein